MDGTFFSRLAVRFGYERTHGAEPAKLEAERAPRRARRPSPAAREPAHWGVGIARCEVCGRTLLDGERAREIRVGDTTLSACILCVIQYQTGRSRSAA